MEDNFCFFRVVAASRIKNPPSSECDLEGESIAESGIKTLSSPDVGMKGAETLLTEGSF
jgi:hypothetical protein